MNRDRAFCIDMLPRVSRTFALSIRLLPSPLKYSVLVAYLLCRIADTIEDSRTLTAAEKEGLLERLQRCLEDADPLGWSPEPGLVHGDGFESLLLQEGAKVFREFHRLPPEDRNAARPWIQEMCGGMAAFVADPASSPWAGAGLANVRDLDRYCYFVAGTVGRLLTNLFIVHAPRIGRAGDAALTSLAVDFGLGLQLTNIVKDMVRDHERGVIYAPNDLCASQGIRPRELFDPANDRAARSVTEALIGRARAHLDNGLRYCLALPQLEYRIRLFCLSALYLAVRTLRAAAHDPRPIRARQEVKISRRDVRRTVVTAAIVAPSNPLTRRYYGLLARA
jgi:farnesyl-diphosphate farnesyltransferase